MYEERKTKEIRELYKSIGSRLLSRRKELRYIRSRWRNFLV